MEVKHTVDESLQKYNDCVIPYFQKFLLVSVSKTKIAKINDFVENVIKIKMQENQYKKDYKSLYKRFYTGILGEAAIEEHLGLEFIDYSIGESSFYNVADLSKLHINMGIKTVELGKFPIVHKMPCRPEIINIKYSENQVYICGIASINALKKYQDDKLILDDNLRKKGTKTGFYGFKFLEPFIDEEQIPDDVFKLPKAV